LQKWLPQRRSRIAETSCGSARARQGNRLAMARSSRRTLLGNDLNRPRRHSQNAGIFHQLWIYDLPIAIVRDWKKTDANAKICRNADAC
jgi:hypothetical protein